MPVSPVVSGHHVRTDNSIFDRPDSDGARWATYEKWRGFASGTQWGAPAAGDPRRRMTFNYARALVVKVASYVFPAAVTFDLAAAPGGEVETDDVPERLLNTTCAELGLYELDLSLEVERSITGDAAVKVTWDVARSRPRVVSVDPGQISVRYSPEDPRDPVEVTHRYQLPAFALAGYGFGPSAADRTDAWINVAEVWTAAQWTMHAAGYPEGVARANPYGWIPYVFLPNNPHPRRFWGESDLVDVAEVARAFNRELSTLAAIMDVSGSPIAVLEGVDRSEGITAQPGAKWELPEGSKAYLLDLLAGQGVVMHERYLEQLRVTMHDLSETPRTAFGDSGRTLSGAALEVEIQPLVQRVNRKRASWDRHYQERNRRILDLLAANGHPAGERRVTVANWPSVLPSDLAADVQQAVMLVGAGVRSRRTASELLGETDPEGEWQRVQEERSAESELVDRRAEARGADQDTPEADKEQAE